MDTYETQVVSRQVSSIQIKIETHSVLQKRRISLQKKCKNENRQFKFQTMPSINSPPHHTLNAYYYINRIRLQ